MNRNRWAVLFVAAAAICALLPTAAYADTGVPTMGIEANGVENRVVVTQPGGIGQFTFSGRAGVRVSLLTVSPSNNDVHRLLAPDGSQVWGASSCCDRRFFSDVQVLPQTGTYTVAIDLVGTTTGVVTVQLWSVPADVVGSLAADGVERSVTSSTPGQNSTFTFSGRAGDRVSLLTVSPSNNDVHRLLAPDGSQVWGALSCCDRRFFSDVQVLPQTGTYTVLIDNSDVSVGRTTVQLWSVPQDTFVNLDVAGPNQAAIVTVPGQNSRYSFTGRAGQPITLATTAPDGGSEHRLLAPDGSQVWGVSSCCDRSFGSGLLVLPQTGTYTVVVSPNDVHLGATSVRLTSADRAVDRVTPNSGGVGGTVTVDVEGRWVPPGATATLVQGTTTLKVDGSVNRATGGTSAAFVHGTVDLHGAPLGGYDLVVSWPDGQRIVRPGAFTVTGIQPAQVKVTFEGGTTLRAGAVNNRYVRVTNLGTNDLILVPVEIDTTSGMNCRIAGDPSALREALLRMVGNNTELRNLVSSLDLTPRAETVGGVSRFVIFIPRLPALGTITFVLQCTPGELDGSIVVRVGDLDNPGHQTGDIDAIVASRVMRPTVDTVRRTLSDNGGPNLSEDEIRRRIADGFKDILFSVFPYPTGAPWDDWAGTGVLAAGMGANLGIIALGVAGVISAGAVSVFLAMIGVLTAGYFIWRGVMSLMGLLDEALNGRRSHDPNEIRGPLGRGTARWIDGRDRLAYDMLFENDRNAGAAAQFVRVATTLDPNVDPATFEFGSAQVADVDIPLTTMGNEAFGSGVIPLNGGTTVSVHGVIDRATGRVDWTFAGPNGLDDPFNPTPYGDFLAPNTTPPIGEGLVHYTVAPRAGLTNGAAITATARITFDEHENGGSVLDTSSWTNHVDAAQPTAVFTGPSGAQNGDFRLTWKGDDTGAGVDHYAVLVSENGGTPTPLAIDPYATSYAFAATPGHTYGFQLWAYDRVGHASAPTTLAIGVNRAPAFVNATPPAAAVVGAAVRPYRFTASGFPAPTIALAQGKLPNGMTLTPEGVLAGTPTKAGKFTFKVKATNSLGTVTTASITITIVKPSTPAIVTSVLPAARVGTAYAQTLGAVGGVAPYTWSVATGTLPAGLTLDAKTGIVIGTPTKAGRYRVTFNVTDTTKPRARVAKQSMTIEVK